MNEDIKLISRLEFDLIKEGKLNFVDTFVKDEFIEGESLYLRNHYYKLLCDTYDQILVTVNSIQSISFNTTFNKRLYRVYFSKA